jgi:hypothetical protein
MLEIPALVTHDSSVNKTFAVNCGKSVDRMHVSQGHIAIILAQTECERDATGVHAMCGVQRYL